MRVGYIHLDYGEWQTDSYNVQEIGLGKALVKLGHELIIVYWMPKDDKRCNTTVMFCPGITKVYLPYRFRFVHHMWPDFSLLDKLDIDLFHLQSDNLLCVPEAVNYCLKKGWKHYCYVGTIHSSSPKAISRKVMDILSSRNFSAFRKTKVFCKTPAVVDELKRRGVKNTEWAPVGLDLDIIPRIDLSKEDIKKKLNLPVHKKIVFLVCALRPDKHPMDIFPLAKQLGDDYLLVHVGAKWMQTDEYMTELNQGYDNIRFIGTIANAEVHEYYMIADYVINFNPSEIFGMAILEAMYHDATVVARHAPGPNCIIENGKSGFLCDSVEDMGRIILEGKKVTCARQRILKEFTWQSAASKFISFALNN